MRFVPTKTVLEVLAATQRCYRRAAPILKHPSMIHFDSAGARRFSVGGLRPRLAILRLVPPGDGLGVWDATNNYFINVRVLPNDDFSGIADSDLRFDDVYRHVLRYYDYIVPAMNAYFEFSNEQEVRAKARLILDRIFNADWTSWSYMPRTRDLSHGRLSLLRRWLFK